MINGFFWILWGLICAWALKTFYFSFDKKKLNTLRLTALGIDFSVLLLFLLPWFPVSRGSFTGWELIRLGNVVVTLLFVSVATSILLFLTNNRLFLKIGSGFHMVTSIVFILTMVRLMPGTFTLTSQSIASVIASLMLLSGNVVVLLLWQQIDRFQSKKSRGFAPIWIILVILLFGGLFAMRQGYFKLSLNNPTHQVTSSTVSLSTTQPSEKKLSLREVCLDKIKDLPAPPFSYKSKSTSGTLLPLHKRKERFPNEDKTSTCITDYSITDVKEQAFKDMGFEYYVPNKTTGRQLNYSAINGQFNRAVDAAYTELMKVKKWERVTPQGEREGGIPYIVYLKEEGVYKMYADVTQGTDMFFSVTLTVIGP